jgi:hypothetical protein
MQTGFAIRRSPSMARCLFAYRSAVTLFSTSACSSVMSLQLSRYPLTEGHPSPVYG